MRAMASLSATEAAKAPSDAVEGTLGCQSSLAPFGLCFALGSVALRARFTHAWSRRLARAAFAPLVSQGAARVYEGGIFVEGACLTVHFDGTRIEVPIVEGDDFGAAYIAVRELFARFAGAAAENLAFYGATCALNGSAVVCIGPPGSGKTVLALHLHRAGLQFCGDEIFLLRARVALQPCRVCRHCANRRLRYFLLPSEPPFFRDQPSSIGHTDGFGMP